MKKDNYKRVALYVKIGLDEQTKSEIYTLADLPPGRIVAEQMEYEPEFMGK